MKIQILIFFLFFSGCYHENRVNMIQELAIPARLSDSLIFGSNFIDKYSSDINEIDYSSTLLLYKSKIWFSFLGKRKNKIYLFDIENPLINDSILLRIKDSVSGTKIFRTVGERLVSYKVKSPYVYLYNLAADSDSAIRKEKIPEISAENIYIKKKSNLIFFLEDSSAMIIVNYGLADKPHDSYLDKGSNFLLLNGKTGEISNIGCYPSDYFKDQKYLTNTLFDFDNKSHIYFTYELNDSIYKMTKDGKILNRAKIGEAPEFLKFNWNKETDLSYVRKYTHMTEANLSLKFFGDKYIFILKRLPEEDLLKPSKYKYVILDTNLNVKFRDTVRHGIYTSFFSGFKNGMLLLSDKFDKAYYYEME